MPVDYSDSFEKGKRKNKSLKDLYDNTEVCPECGESDDFCKCGGGC